MGGRLRLTIRDFAQIAAADIAFGDLTILVGPQATGKSLILQLLKFACDGPRILGVLKLHGFDWEGSRQKLLDFYFGEGMSTEWSGRTRVEVSGRPLRFPQRARSQQPGERVPEHSLFFIPAHRTLAIVEGWPRAFRGYTPDTPFVVRQFSDDLYALLTKGMGRDGSSLFPLEGRLKSPVRGLIKDSVFHGGSLRLRTLRGRREFVLQYGGQFLPYMEWSAGQREFMPLLLGLYHLLPGGKVSKRPGVEWVVIEEPEMGLHPKGIVAVFAAILDLLDRGYRVALATHAPISLDVAWALQELRGKKSASRLLCQALDLTPAAGVLRMAGGALEKEVRVYRLDHDRTGRVASKDISSLDPGAGDPDIAGWGGLTGYSGKISEAVSRALAGGGRR